MKPSRPDANHLPAEVARKAARRLRARAAGRPGLWFGLGLDHAHPGRYSWTLSLLLAGLALGCIAAWQWVDRMGPPHD